MPEHPPQKPNTDDNRKQVESTASAAHQSAKTRPKESADNDTRFRIHWNIVAAVFLGIAAFTGASALVWHAADWIRASVDESVSVKLNDERVLRQIAAQVKPAIMFDAKESIVSDMGAQQFIKDIQVGQWNVQGLPELIKIDFTRYFANAPMLSSVYADIHVTPRHGRLSSWEFGIHWSEVYMENRSDTNRLFRLEIVP
jgi:hypothetical protein